MGEFGGGDATLRNYLATKTAQHSRHSFSIVERILHQKSLDLDSVHGAIVEVNHVTDKILSPAVLPTVIKQLLSLPDGRLSFSIADK